MEGDTACEPIETPVDGQECPDICNGGCVDLECQILCRPGDQTCAGEEVSCPPELACDVDCEGEGVCAGTVVTCPGDFACSLSCAGPDACSTAQFQCGFSECAIECGPDPSACTDTRVRCGSGSCTGECVAGAMPTFEGCEEACNCEAC